MSVLIAIAVCLALVGTLLQVRDWYVARRQLIAHCAHRWTYYSAWYEGRFWQRRCRDCPKQEPVALEDVPAEWRWQEQIARTARVSRRRRMWCARGETRRMPRDREEGTGAVQTALPNEQRAGGRDPIPEESDGSRYPVDDVCGRKREGRSASDVGGGQTARGRRASRG